MQLERSPGHDGWLGDLGTERVVNIGDDGLVVDGVGDHAVRQLEGEHGPQLVPGQHGVHVAEGQSVEASIPVPDADVLDLGRHHGFVGHVAMRLYKIAAHHPPGVIVWVSIGLGHGRHAGEPISPTSLGSGQRLGERDWLTVQLQVAADVEVDGHVVAALHDKFDQVGLPFQTQLVLEHAAVGAVGQVAYRLQTAAVVALLPHLGADAEAYPSRHARRQTDGQCVTLVKGQGKHAQTGLEKEGVGIGSQVAGERHPFFINEAKILDVGRTKTIGFQARLDGRQSFGQLDIETICVGVFEHEQTRTPIAEGHTGDVNVVSE